MSSRPQLQDAGTAPDVARLRIGRRRLPQPHVGPKRTPVLRVSTTLDGESEIELALIKRFRAGACSRLNRYLAELPSCGSTSMKTLRVDVGGERIRPIVTRP